jgi:Gpi18-like mannosyltransferase
VDQVAVPAGKSRLATAADRLREARASAALTAVCVYASIRVLDAALEAFLLRRGGFRVLHMSLWPFMTRSYDAGQYWKIAAHGYFVDYLYNWFPGYPAAIRALSWIPGVGIYWAGLLVTFAAGVVAAWGLARLGLRLTDDRRVSVLLVALWSVAPGSIVLSMLYSEALFCALAFWALLAAVERRWLTAGILAALAGTVRSTALAVIAAVGIAALVAMIQFARTRQPARAYWRPLAAIVTAPLGLCGYWAFVALRTHRIDGWFWIESTTAKMSNDWGASTLRIVIHSLLWNQSAAYMLTSLVVIAGVALMLWSLTERLPACMHACMHARLHGYRCRADDHGE